MLNFSNHAEYLEYYRKIGMFGFQNRIGFNLLVIFAFHYHWSTFGAFFRVVSVYPFAILGTGPSRSRRELFTLPRAGSFTNTLMISALS